MDVSLDKRIALVTGAAQGMGEAIALALAEEGATVIAADINFQKVKNVAERLKELTPRSFAVKVDVCRAKDLDKVVRIALERLGRIDILINNAGVCPRTPFADISEKEWDRVLATNLKSVFLLSQKVLGHMKKKRYGRIINIASGAGKIGGVQVGAHYSASKAAIICLTKTLALHGAKYGINVNAVCPGVIGTEMTYAISKEQIKKYEQVIPLGRIGSAADVANAVVFLASDAASYITGEITDVNGGFIMD